MHVKETNTFKQTKPLHVMEETIDSKTFQKAMKEANILHDAYLEAISSFLAQGGKGISFSKEDPIIGELPNHVEGNNAINSRVDLVPHAEEGGALAPTRGILRSLQGGP